jgi:hypothetical protein
MPALVAGIHVLLAVCKDVDSRHKAGHDEKQNARALARALEVSLFFGA